MTDSTLPAPIDAETGVALLTAADQAAIHDYALAEKSAATRRAYRSDFAAFTTWCDGCCLVAIPAASETVAAFIADQANAGFRASTLGRRVAAAGQGAVASAAPAGRSIDCGGSGREQDPSAESMQDGLLL